jgi:hypothetical protein
VSLQTHSDLKIIKVVLVKKNINVILENGVLSLCQMFSISDFKKSIASSYKFWQRFCGVDEILIMFDIVTSFNIYQQRDNFVSIDTGYAKEMVKKDFKAIYEHPKISLYLLDSWLERNSINCQCHTTRKEYVKSQTDYMYSKEDRDFVISNLLDYIERR